jgi:3-phosphoshikimate 1-carboxyvinyltransferase
MEMTIRHSSLTGSVRAPPSKSCTHRALFCAALAEGESRIHSPLTCDDTLATAQALSKLGVRTSWNEEYAHVTRHGELKEPSGEISCGESGTTLRFMTAICATTPYQAEISGRSSLLRRPVASLAIALGELGADCKTNQGYPPVHVKGPIQGGSVEVRGNISSQYVSALLLAAPLARRPMEITVSGRLESRSYVKMTVEMQSKFGVQVDAAEDMTRFHSESQAYCASDVQVEGDWSSAAFLLAASAIAGEKVSVQGLAQETFQADQCLLSILKKMNARVNIDPSSVAVEKSQLEPIEIDMSDSPDLVPAVCALCAVADGVSTVTGIRRLRIKESDRVLAMSNGLKEMGVKTRESNDSLTISGGELRKATVDPHRDHRIAMAFAALGLCTDEIKIVDAECVGKSYPSFWKDLRSLGADVIAL